MRGQTGKIAHADRDGSSDRGECTGMIVSEPIMDSDASGMDPSTLADRPAGHRRPNEAFRRPLESGLAIWNVRAGAWRAT